jgi:hypothetical protein
MTLAAQIVLPFEIIFTYYVASVFKTRTNKITWMTIVAALALNSAATIWNELFPLASMLCIIAIKLYYNRHIWYTFVVVLIINSFMLFFFLQVPNGHFFAAAVNYYICYAVIHTLTLNEIYAKRILLIATVKYLFLTGGGTVFSKDIDEKIIFAASMLIIYYLIKVTQYYRKSNATKTN